MRKQGSCVEKEIMQGTNVDRTLCGRVSQNDRDKRKKYVHGVANRRIEDG